ncbi:MAG: DNA mismatch repair endonuclease MutL [Bacteroidales bacterium]|nr:DNA mismatch repair endonuclease MutL [Bacteroidales bacterium]
MLKVLPENLSNLIAAGEVVARPASVVKELMENAVDAGARTVTVSVTDAGRTLIQVIDDGCGMTPEEASLCFERHATSKISEAADLEHITTFGFRGEALPSIAAVAEVTLKTRRPEDSVGTEVVMAASKQVSAGPVSAPSGTNIAVRNLFYNVPARRKFLKSDNSELRAVIQEFLRVALTRPELALRLISGGKDIYNLRAVENHKRRIQDIFGRELTADLAEVGEETSVVTVHGYVGAPEAARKTAGNQYLFINGRYFRSAYLHKAVCRPYEKLIPEGYTPTYFLWLETEPDKVDVNIHPAKTEVKFAEEQMVFEMLAAVVREGLGRNAMMPAIDFDMKGAPDIPTLQSTVSRGGYMAPPKIDFNPLFDPFEAPKPYDGGGMQQLFEDAPAFAEDEFILLRGKYIVTKTEQGLLAVHIGRARERIFYEHYLERIAERMPVAQQTLFPVSLQRTPDEVLTLEEEAATLTDLGFDIRSLGGGTLVVNALPEGYPTDSEGVAKAIDELIAALRDETLSDDYRTFLAGKMARSAAAAGAATLTRQGAQDLLAQLFQCRQSQRTADGRKVSVLLTLEDLDKLL